MAETEAEFLFDDAAVEIIPPRENEEWHDGRICLCCQLPSRWMDDDGCGICDDCLSS